MNTRKLKHVLIPLDRSTTEKAEIFLIHNFNARYRMMTEKEKISETVQDELEALSKLRELRMMKTRSKVKNIKEELFAKGMIGLTEDEWHQYKHTGESPLKLSRQKKTRSVRKAKRAKE